MITLRSMSTNTHYPKKNETFIYSTNDMKCNQFGCFFNHVWHILRETEQQEIMYG